MKNKDRVRIRHLVLTSDSVSEFLMKIQIEGYNVPSAPWPLAKWLYNTIVPVVKISETSLKNSFKKWIEDHVDEIVTKDMLEQWISVLMNPPYKYYTNMPRLNKDLLEAYIAKHKRIRLQMKEKVKK